MDLYEILIFSLYVIVMGQKRKFCQDLSTPIHVRGANACISSKTFVRNFMPRASLYIQVYAWIFMEFFLQFQYYLMSLSLEFPEGP